MQNYANLTNFKSDTVQICSRDINKKCPANSTHHNNTHVPEPEVQCITPDYAVISPKIYEYNNYILKFNNQYDITNKISEGGTNTKAKSQVTKTPTKISAWFKNANEFGKRILNAFGIQLTTSSDGQAVNQETTYKTIDYTESEINIKTVKKEAKRYGIRGLRVTGENALLLHNLLQGKNQGNDSGFTSEEIVDLSKDKNLNPDAALQLIKITNPDKSPKYTFQNIKKLANKNHNSDIIPELAKMTDADGNPRFSAEDVEKLSSNNLNSNTVMNLVNKADEHGKPLFNACAVSDLAGKYYNQDLVVKLAGMTDNNGEPKYDPWAISILASNKLNPKTVMDLIEMTDDEGLPKFGYPAIQVLADKNLKRDKVMNFVQIFKNVTNPYKIAELSQNNSEILEFLTDKSYMEELNRHSAGKYQKEVTEMLNPQNMNFYQLKSILDTELSKSDYLKSVEKLSKSTFKLAYDKPNRYLSGIDLKYSTPVNGKLPQLPEAELKYERQTIVDFFKCNTGQILKVLKYVDTDTVSHMMDRRTIIFSGSLNDLNGMSNENLDLLSQLLTCKSEKTGKALSPKEKIQTCQIMKIFDDTNLDMTEFRNSAQKGMLNLDKSKQTILNSILTIVGINPDNPNIVKDNTKFNEEFSYLILKNKFNEDTIRQFNQCRTEYDKLINECRINPKTRSETINAEKSRLASHGENMTSAQRRALKSYIEMLGNIEKFTNNQIFDEVINSMRISSFRKINNCELFTVIKKTVTGDFKEFITDETNIYGQTNKKTKQIFEDTGLNYDKWLNPDIEDVKLDAGGKQMTIKLWDRNPQEDLFIGNKTTCCTAIGTGGNGAATPSYLLNTSYNVVELYDSNDNAVGMSRVFMGKIDEKPALIMDNIELNKTYVKGMNDEQLTTIRNGFFNYMNQYAQQVTGDKNTRIRFYSRDIHVPNDDLAAESKLTDFIGAFVSLSEWGKNSVYVNSAGCDWINPAELKTYGKIVWLIVPQNSSASSD